MATYGKDTKGDYKIRDDGSKVYRDSSNAKYFPNDYGGRAGWSTGGSSSSSGSSSSGSSSSGSSSKKSSSSSSSSSKSSGGSSGSSGYKITVDAKGNIYKDGRYMDLYNPTVLKALQNDPQGLNALKQARAVKSGGASTVPVNTIGGNGGIAPGTTPQQGQQDINYLIAQAIEQAQQQWGQQQQPPVYEPEPVQRMTPEQAQQRAMAYIEPMYAELEQQAADQALKDGVARGLNDAALQGFVQEARMKVQQAKSQALAAYVENLMREDEARAMQQEQMNYQQWLGQAGLGAQYAGMNNDNMNSLLGNLFGWGQLQNQNRNSDIQQGYLEEARKMNDWTRNVQFPAEQDWKNKQYGLQERGVSLDEQVQAFYENTVWPEQLKLDWYNANTGRITSANVNKGGADQNPWGFKNMGDVQASVTGDVAQFIADIAQGQTYGNIAQDLKYKESKGMLPVGYKDLVLGSLQRLAPGAFKQYAGESIGQDGLDFFRGN